ncbi:DNA primase (plasmid) [Brevundimonas staleyi]|uniref:DNA primase n=1 Tax=Brevundimonas staleyi TaxID=74326 RepID=A0ABW0FMQ1_9CAUL
MSDRQPPMRFDDQFLAELKACLPPSVVIGRTVKLKRRGAEFVGLSPFSQETTPSFTVNDEKGFFHCFSSGKHGDVIAFLQETERLSFPEAVRRLAADAGMALPVVGVRAERLAQRAAELGAWLERAAAWYESELKGPGGGGARAYLARRGLPEDQWARFRLGYAPASSGGVKGHLAGLGARIEDLVEAGLLVAPSSGGPAYDRFRDRIIFPIRDGGGRVISFGGRALEPNGRAKYLNGPETRLFSKGKVLYGLAEARELLLRRRRAGDDDAALVLVEGYLDVIACQRAEVAAVAPMGTALTEAQMEALWRLHPEPVLSFDADAAGRRAVGRAIDQALPLLRPDRTFRFVGLAAGKDPDELYRTQGPGALRDQLAEPRPFAEVLFAQERDREPLDTPEHWAGLRQRLRVAAERIADIDVALAYRADLDARLATLEARAGGGEGAACPSGFAAALAIAAVRHPDWARPYPGTLERSGFGDDRLAPIAEALIHWRETGMDPARRLSEGDGPLAVAAAEAAAATVAAPFLDLRMERGRARNLWRVGYEALVEVTEAEGPRA